MRHVFGLAIMAALLGSCSARADFLSGSYSSLAVGTTVDLTAEGTLDWAKFGTDNSNNNTNFFVATKIGNPVINPNITPLGTAPSGNVTLDQFGNNSTSNPTSPGNLNFTWSNGNFGMGYPNSSLSSVNSVVSETILPAVNSYPLGLGAEFTANVGPDTRILDVYVQGFNSVMTLTASLSGGASVSTDVTPTVVNPPTDPTNNNYYAFGEYEIQYSGDASETLTVSVQTSLNQPSNPPWAGANQAAFPNAGIFAATVREGQVNSVPEPASLTLFGIGFATLLCFGQRRRLRSI